MSETADKDDGMKESPRPLSLVLLMAGTVADTTWRLFVPTIGGTFLGVWGDRTFGTKPWLTVVGIALGAGAATLLLYMQIKRIKRHAP